MFFAEYIAADVEVDLQIELAELQRQMARWYRHWQDDAVQQREVAERSDAWQKRMQTATERLQPAREVA